MCVTDNDDFNNNDNNNGDDGSDVLPVTDTASDLSSSSEADRPSVCRQFI